MKRFKEWLHLVGINLLVKQRNFFEFLRVIVRYYSDFKFMRVDLTLLAKYFIRSPFTISKDFMIQKGEEDIYVYGETPLTTLEKIAKNCAFSSKDTIFELGCGRGRVCFWIEHFIGCKVVGIDYIPEFIQKANAVKCKYQLNNLIFEEQDILKANLSGATIIYLYGTCYETPFIKKIIKKIEKLPAGLKVITVSYTLNAYTEKPMFEVLKKLNCSFTWGRGDVYLQIKK